MQTRVPPIRWICIPTCDRPELLRRSIGSLSRALGPETGCAFLVADDSRQRESSRLNESVIREWSRDTDEDVYYLDRRRKRLLAAQMSKATGLSEALIRFGLTGYPYDAPSYGANQNAIQLFTKGCGILCADDDTMFRFYRFIGTSPLQKSDLAPLQHWRFSSYDELLDLSEPVHLQIPGHFERQLALGTRPGRQAIVCAIGIAGDAGSSSSEFLTAPDNSTTVRGLERSEHHYHLWRSTRWEIQHAHAPTATQIGTFMTASYAMNNALPAAPFFPLFRGSDATWGLTLAAEFPAYDMIHSDVAIAHVPEERVGYTDDISTLRMATICKAMLFRELHADCQLSSRGGMSSIKAALLFSPSDFEAYVRETLRDYFQDLIHHLESSLIRVPPRTRGRLVDVLAQINRVSFQLNKRYSSPGDLLRGHRITIPVVQRMMLKWAELWEAWPVLEKFMTTNFDRQEYSINRAR